MLIKRDDVVCIKLINSKKPLLVYNLADLSKATKDNIIVIGKVGNKKRIEIAKEIEKRKLESYNLNMKKIMEKKKKIMESKKWNN